MFKFKKGDEVLFNNEVYTVMSVSFDDLFLVSKYTISNGKNTVCVESVDITAAIPSIA